MKTLHVEKPTGLPLAARQILASYPDAHVFAFYGAMGVGKTALIQAICEELGVLDAVSSPSFPIINEYAMTRGGEVYHFDFYRIKNATEAYDLGYEEYFYSGRLCLVEWPEKVGDLLPGDSVKIYMEDRSGVRVIRF